MLTLSVGLFSCIRNLSAHGTHCCSHSLASSRRVGSKWPLFRLPAWWSYHVSRNGDVSVLGVALCSRWQRHHLRLFRFTSSAPAGTGLKQRPPSSFFRFVSLAEWRYGRGGMIADAVVRAVQLQSHFCVHTAHIATSIRWRRADELALRGRCSVYLLGILTMSVGMVMCRCWHCALQ